MNLGVRFRREPIIILIKTSPNKEEDTTHKNKTKATYHVDNKDTYTQLEYQYFIRNSINNKKKKTQSTKYLVKYVKINNQ